MFQGDNHAQITFIYGYLIQLNIMSLEKVFFNIILKITFFFFLSNHFVKDPILRKVI